VCPALSPTQEPEKDLRAAIARIVAANQADRKTLDWQGQYEALNDCRRAVAHHPELLTARPGLLHEMVAAAAPVVDALRSLCAKNALALFGELFAAGLSEAPPPGRASAAAGGGGGAGGGRGCATITSQSSAGALRRAMDKELDEVVPLLLKKAGEVSTAGVPRLVGAHSASLDCLWAA
jgi:hypothetical protein